MLTPNDSLHSPKLQGTPKENYRECYAAVRRNIKMQRSYYQSEEIEIHWQACLNIFGPQLLWLAWSHWFTREAATYTGIGAWHGWHNPVNYRLWRQSAFYRAGLTSENPY